MRKYYADIVPLLMVILGFWGFNSCQRGGKEPFYQADITGIEIEGFSIGRYEELLFNLDPGKLLEEIEPFVEDYRAFLGDEIFTKDGQVRLIEYITDSLNMVLYRDTKEVWPSLNDLEVQLTEALRYYSYHFREEQLPLVYSYISGLDYHYPVKYHNQVIAIGLDMYLGSDYPWYSKIGVPSYLTFAKQPEFVITDVVRILAEKHVQQLSRVPETLLDFMIHEGKLLFFLDCMLPRVHDTLKIAFTTEQLGWFDNNTGFAWSYFLDNDLLFTSDRQAIIKFVGEAPFTAPFGRTSPPRTAAYIGWQIVREYMRKNKEITLPELLAATNSHQILTQSGFRPRR